MKKLTAIILLLASVIALSLSVSAASPRLQVKNGTPTVDGKLDNLYLDSLKVELGTHGDVTGNLSSGAPAGTEVINNGYAYFLWDKDYIYMYAVVWDTTTLCDFDNISLMFNMNSKLETISVSFGNADGSIEAGSTLFNADDCVAVVGTNTESKYHFAEIRIALADELKSSFLAAGKEAGFHWIYWNKDETKTELGSSTGGSANDWGSGQTFMKFNKEAASGTGIATNAQGQELYSSTAAAAAPNAFMTASGETTNSGKDDNKGNNNNPQTSDGIAVVSAVALCAAAAALILVKKKRA